MGRRGAGVGAVVAVVALLVTGCGRLPTTVSLTHQDEGPGVPAACLDEGLAVALGSGVYALPLAGSVQNPGDIPAWETAALQGAGSAAAAGPLTVCAYVADHPSPFSTHGGEDTIVCVAVDVHGAATLLGTRFAARDESESACGPEGDGG